jgi:hypothetical protein
MTALISVLNRFLKIATLPVAPPSVRLIFGNYAA